MKLSFNIAGREFSFGATKSLSPDAAAFLKGTDVDESTSGGAKLREPYNQSSAVYIAISCLAENVAQVPLRISRVPQSASKQLARGSDAHFKRRVLGENIIESGEVVDLFDHPHPTMDRALFWANIISWKALRGEFFVVALDAMDAPVDLATDKGRIKSMLTLEPGMFWHMVQGYELVAWRYTGSPLLSPLPSEILLPTEVIHHRTFNPYLYWRGLSPLTLATLAAMTDYAASQFMKGLMTNNADTGVIVSTDQQPTPEQRAAILAALKDRKRKAGTADRPLLLWGGMKVEKPTLSNVDLEFLSNRKYNREEIFAVFKVPPSMAGIETASGGKAGGSSGSSSGGSQQEDRRVFTENTVTNLCRQIEASFQPIVKRFDPSLELWFDVDSLAIMQEARRDRLTAAANAFGIGVPLNDIVKTYNLGFPEYPWGNKGYLPFNLQEAGGTPPAPEINSPAPATDPAADPKQNIFARFVSLTERTLHPAKPAVAGQSNALRSGPAHTCTANPEYEASIAGSVKAKTGVLKKFFFEQRGRVLAALAKIQGSKSGGAEQCSAFQIRALEDLFDQGAENEKLLAKLRARLITDLEFGGAQLYREIGAGDFNLKPTEALEYLAARENAIKDINATTWARLRGSLGEGLANGDSYNQQADRIKAVYGASEGRAQVIGLTETNSAINTGRQNAMVAAKVQRKGWQTSHLENTRLTHIENEQVSKASNGLEVLATWPNGCRYPGDPAGAPGETINCRCFGYAIAGKSLAAPTRFLRWEEFIAEKEMKNAPTGDLGKRSAPESGRSLPEQKSLQGGSSALQGA